MEWTKFVILLVLTASVTSLRNQMMLEEFNSFVLKFNKTYANESERDAALANYASERLACMEQDLRFFAKKSFFRMDVNQRSDETLQEKTTWRGLAIDAATADGIEPRADPPIFPPAPASLDYRDLGYVTDVLDQGYYCGSCYAFASLCALEGQFAKKFNNLQHLSTQSVVDCSTDFGNFGCDGGYIDATYRYLASLTAGVQDFESYPYEDYMSSCRYDSDFAVNRSKGFQRVYGNEENLKRMLAAVGPLVVGIKADLLSIYDYMSGIYDDRTCKGPVNHVVCLVGYGTDTSVRPPIDYWIIKNSWSDYWGEGGYMRMKRGMNLCNIINYVFYPQV